MRVRHDLALGELAHLVADRLERLVETAVADRRAMMLAHQVGEPRAVFRGVAGRDQLLDFRRDAVRHLFELQSKIARAHHLALAHRDAAKHLREEFAEADPDEEFFQLAEPPGFAHPLRIGGELAQRLGIGRKPRQPVRGALLLVDQFGGNPAVSGNARPDGSRRIGEQRVHGADRRTGILDQARAAFGPGCRNCHRVLRPQSYSVRLVMHCNTNLVRRTRGRRNPSAYQPLTSGSAPGIFLKFYRFLTISALAWSGISLPHLPE